MPSYLLGSAASAYYSTTLLNGSNTATVLSSATIVSNIMDLSLDVDSEFVDVTTRGEAAAGFASQVAVLKNGQVTFDMRWQPGDAFFEAVKDVWLGTTSEIAMFLLDQPKATTGAQGLVSNFTVSFGKTEALRDIQKVSVTLGISSQPEWYEVPA